MAKYKSLVDGSIVVVNNNEHLNFKSSEIQEVYRMYKPEEVSVKKIEKREEGLEVEDEIVKVEDGTLGSFIKDWDTYNKNGQSKKEDLAICVFGSTGAKKIIKLREDNQYHPKSAMGVWLKTYKKAPYVGQKVKSVTNENGFFEIILRG